MYIAGSMVPPSPSELFLSPVKLPQITQPNEGLNIKERNERYRVIEFHFIYVSVPYCKL
jgi:hypothetical protein